MSGRTLGVSKADWLGMSTVSVFWAMVEVGVALIAINLPALRPGQALRGSIVYKWLTGLSSSLKFSNRGSGSSSSKNSGSRGPRGKKSSGSGDSSMPIQGPWPSLATQARSMSDSADEEMGLKRGTEIGNGEGIYCERDYQVTESVTSIPVQEQDFRRRYAELFPPASAHVMVQPRERV